MKQFVIICVFFLPLVLFSSNIIRQVRNDGLEITYNLRTEEFNIEQELCPGTKLFTFTLGQETIITEVVLAIGNQPAITTVLPDVIKQAVEEFKALYLKSKEEQAAQNK